MLIINLQLSDPTLPAGQSCTYSKGSRVKEAERSIEACEVVHHSITQREGENYQGCLPTGSGTTDEDVQFPGVQRLQALSKLLGWLLTGIHPDSKIVYRRYASLFFIAGCASTDNELITLEVVHRYVEQMDKYYGNVCELDIIFNFQKAYFILDELLLAGEMQESSKKNVLRVISAQDSIEDTEVSEAWFLTLLGDCRQNMSMEEVPYLGNDVSQILTPTTPVSGRRGSYEDYVNHGPLYMYTEDMGGWRLPRFGA